MNFKDATDRLFARVDHEELAKRLGVSVALIRQARLRSNALAHRAPPKDWPEAVIQLAEAQIRHYGRLVEGLRKKRG